MMLYWMACLAYSNASKPEKTTNQKWAHLRGFKDNRDNRDNSLNLVFANRHKSKVRARSSISYTKNAGFAAIGCSTRGYWLLS